MGADHDNRTSEAFDRYITQTLEIRSLSSPRAEDIRGAEDYRTTLLRNFTRIGTLAADNNHILQTKWFPLIDKKEALTDAEAASLEHFAASLLDAYKMENIDLTMRHKQTRRLLRDADEKKDTARIIRMLDARVEALFALMHMTQRLSKCDHSCYRLRDAGIAAASRMLDYLPHEAFSALPDEDTKERILINARYISALFDRGDDYGNQEVNDRDLTVLLDALRLADDPFYRGAAPSYNWTYHTFRTLQYISQLLYSGNIREYRGAHLSAIRNAAKDLHALWHREKEMLGRFSTDDFIDLHLFRADFFNGNTDIDTYKRQLVSLYEKCNDDDFSFFNQSLFLLVPMEMMRMVTDSGIDPADYANVAAYYRRLMNYIHRMPKRGSLSFLLTYLADIITTFRPVPGGPDFEQFCLRLIASLHPPTYVHTLSVADFSVCIATHLIRRRPDLFVGLCGTNNTDEVAGKESAIVDFVRHGALCHDFGKLFVTEVIMTYGRNLFDEEFYLIKQHPLIGAYCLERHEETKAYANIARFHHQWHDGSAGYPIDASCAHLPEKAVIDIVACADCLDASTDDVGRSYKKGKTLDEYIAEVHQGGGTRYAPYLAELLSTPEVRADLEHILAVGRDNNYRNTYRILAS